MKNHKTFALQKEEQMELFILIRAGLKGHRGVLAGVFVLILLVSLALGTALTLWVNAGNHIEAGLTQAGFGELSLDLR